MRWILIILVGSLLLGCDDGKDFSKDYKTRRILDSLFRKERVVLDSELAVQCSIFTAQRIDGMVDSILVVRRQEVEDILRREALENAENK